MGELAAQHIYFRLPYLQWFAHKTDGTLAPEMKTELLQLLEQLPMYQRQAKTFLAEVLDIDQTGRETQRSMRSRYLFDVPRDPALFCFQTIPVSFGPVGEELCGQILQPDTIRDLIDFSLRECVTSGIPVRRCRNCGRYFPLTGRVTAEYCERPNADRKPCGTPGLFKSGPRTVRTTPCSKSTAGSTNGISPGSGQVNCPLRTLPLGASGPRQRKRTAMTENSRRTSSRNG